MRVQVTRRSAVIASAGVTAMLLAACAFGPLVRARARAEALRRGVVLEIGGVRLAWAGVRLLDVAASPVDVPQVRIRAPEVRLGLSLTLHLDSVALSGGTISLNGPERALRDDLRTWSRRGGPQSSSGGVRHWHLDAHGFGLRWDDGISREPRVDIPAIQGTWESGAVRLSFPEGVVRAGSLTLTLSQVVAEMRDGKLLRARCGSVLADWTLAGDGGQGPLAPPQENPAKPSFIPPPALAARAGATTPKRAIAEPTNRTAVDMASSAMTDSRIAFPALPGARSKVRTAARILSDAMAPSTDLGVDALMWKISRANDRVAFSIGPGPLTIGRSGSEVEVRFSADPALATTPLALRLVLPTGQGDAALNLDGGPISLEVLGIREGAAGLVDVHRATVSGRARAVLADDGKSLTFDGEGGTRDLALDNPRLAPDVVRELDLQLHSRGVLSEGALRLDDFGASLGAISLSAGGELEQDEQHISGAFRFEVGAAGCQALLESVPAALLPDLRDTKIDGTFAALGRVAFDSRSLDELSLVYDVGDRCRIVGVPPWLSRDQFEHPFPQKIYLPDGSLAEQMTGPGTSNWTSLDEITPYMQVAVLTTEDGAFPRHHGFNRASIRASLIANIKARRFVRGASTITMQLAKNLFLSRDKTLSRKLEEVVLTEYLEQTFSKSELMELYLNVIEFGPAVYGVTAAADYYFGRTPAELNLAESLFLSSLLPSPRRYGAMRDAGGVPDGWMRTLHALMEVAHKNGHISDAELAEGEAEPVVFWTGSGERPTPRPAISVRPKLEGDGDDAPPAVIHDGP